MSNKLTNAVEEGITYPFLTREIGGYQRGGGSDAPSALAGSPTRTAQDSIRQVLGWRYRNNDAKGFVAALNRAFDLKEVEGHTEWTWKPQNYMVQADLGEITGAQASILTRAKVIVEQALPLLDGLTPLRTDADYEDMEAVRSIIRNAMNELLREFGAIRGPKVQRVEHYFNQLLGNEITFDDEKPSVETPENVGGYLGLLLVNFGLEKRSRINTIVEEQNLTNALILNDYVISLKQTWVANRKYFDRKNEKTEPFLGTQLVLLSQLFETISETVREVYDAMDSVFLGAVERQTAEITFANSRTETPLTIAELLSWIEDFATVEARLLIQDSGKDGVVTVTSTLDRLHTLVKGALEKTTNTKLPSAFYTSRVQRAFKELEILLEDTKDKASRITRSSGSTAPTTGVPPVTGTVPTTGAIAPRTTGTSRSTATVTRKPKIDFVNPPQGTLRSGLILTITGSYFDIKEVELSMGSISIPGYIDNSKSDTTNVTAMFNLNWTMQDGTYQLIITNQDGQKSDAINYEIIKGEYEIDEVENLIDVNLGTSASIIVPGHNFKKTIRPGNIHFDDNSYITVTYVNVVSPEELHINIDIDYSATPGARKIYIVKKNSLGNFIIISNQVEIINIK